jgi:putative endonuclease
MKFCPERARSLGESKGTFVYYCYILRCADDSFYVGVTEDPPQRVQVHNEGKGSSWTAARRPVHLVWTEEHPTLSAARKRENQLKRWGREKKEFLVGGSPRLRSGQGA